MTGPHLPSRPRLLLITAFLAVTAANVTGLARGVYLLRITAGALIRTQKTVLCR